MSEFVAAMPFAAKVGIEIDSATAEEVRAGLEWAPDLCTAGGILHGGAIMALGDSVGGLCAYLNLPDGAATATVESKTNFFRPVREGRVAANARPLHVGGSFVVVQTNVADAAGKLVAQVTQTQAVLR